MPLSFTCPYCEHTWMVDDQFVGQSGPCASCGKTIEITIPERPVQTAANNSGKNILMSLGMLLVTVACIGALAAATYGLIYYVVPSRAPQSTPGAFACVTNLSRIGQAMLDYHAQHGHFPPAYTVDAQGKPLHSWRVLLLPYLGQNSIYQQIDLKLPWDDPHHQLLQGQTPQVYLCPDDRSASTSYFVVTGPGMIFDGSATTRMQQITDGASDTILVVEASGSSVNWMEPQDLLPNMAVQVNSGVPGELGSFHIGNGAHVVMADGKVERLSDSLQPQYLQGKLSKDAGDQTHP